MPESVGDQRDGVSAGRPIVPGVEQPTLLRPRAENAEILGVDVAREQALRLISPGEHDGSRASHAEPLDALHPRSPVLDVGVGRHDQAAVGLELAGDEDDPILIRIRQRLEQRRVGDAVDQRARTDSDGERQDHDQRETRLPCECAQGDANVVPEHGHQWFLPPPPSSAIRHSETLTSSAS